MQSNNSGWADSMGESQPLPHIQEQQEPYPFNDPPTEISTQVHSLVLTAPWPAVYCRGSP